MNLREIKEEKRMLQFNAMIQIIMSKFISLIYIIWTEHVCKFNSGLDAIIKVVK